jgi:hypothetical protein
MAIKFKVGQAYQYIGWKFPRKSYMCYKITAGSGKFIMSGGVQDYSFAKANLFWREIRSGLPKISYWK